MFNKQLGLLSVIWSSEIREQVTEFVGVLLGIL